MRERFKVVARSGSMHGAWRYKGVGAASVRRRREVRPAARNICGCDEMLALRPTGAKLARAFALGAE